MLNNITRLASLDSEKKVFYFSALILGLFVIIGTLLESLPMMVLPFGLFFAFLIITNYRLIFYLFLFLIPFTMEVQLTGSLGTDLPAEPLMILFTVLFGIRVLLDLKDLKSDFVKHPVSLLILLHLTWILITAVTAETPIISIKYLLAKIWYIVPFYFFSIYMFRKEEHFKTFFWIIFISCILCIMVVSLNHASMGFSFTDVNLAVKPFFRNKVNYASLLVIFLPFLVFSLSWAKRTFIIRSLIIGGIFLFLMAIYLSFTRAAMISVFIAASAFVIIRLKLIRIVLLSTAMIVLIGLSSILLNNRYLDYAPEFEKTVTHTNFNNLVEATAKGQDVSTMERVYRWLAGYHMVKERPVMGFGPGNFYDNYKAYTVNKFRTYVSHNPDKSGIHCYYLMIMVEQGIVGFLIFLALCITILLKGNDLYHRLDDTFYKQIVMSSLLGIIIILSILLINDMLEAVKVGSLFFLFASFIMVIDLKLETGYREKK